MAMRMKCLRGRLKSFSLFPSLLAAFFKTPKGSISLNRNSHIDHLFPEQQQQPHCTWCKRQQKAVMGAFRILDCVSIFLFILFKFLPGCNSRSKVLFIIDFFLSKGLTVWNPSLIVYMLKCVEQGHTRLV